MRKTLLLLALAAACSGSRESGWTEEELTPDALEWLMKHRDADVDAEEREASANFGGVAADSVDGRARAINPTPAGPRAPSGSVPAGMRTPSAKKAGKAPTPRSWRRSTLAAHSAKLQVGVEEELPLEATHVSVRVDGFRARVVVDLYYRNTKDKRLHGMLKLRLPDGAVPDYTAFGIAAKIALPKSAPTSVPELEKRHVSLKQARMVPRTKAARAYTETVRRKIDPALVEWSGAGIYTVRVFPLEPGKVHQIAIAYDVDLMPVGENLEYRLDLPEECGELTVEINNERHEQPDQRTFFVTVEKPGNLALTTNDPALGPLYAARIVPDLPDEPAQAASTAVFLIDTSLSSNPDKLNIWLDLMTAVLERNRETLREFRVGFFDVGTHWWRRGAIRNTPIEVERLRQYARTLVVEGATDIGQALAAAHAFEGRCDLFLLSDGSITWGESEVRALRVRDEHTLFAYTTGLAGTDSRLLRRLARESGGAVFVANNADEVATAHTKRPWRIASVDAPGTDVILRGRPTSIFPGQPLIVAGRGVLDGAIKLTLTQGERRLTVESTAEPIESDLAQSVYGQIAVDQLEEFAHLTRESARAYAQHFRVVGRTCSLVMLESEADYKRYEITPADDTAFIRGNPASATVAGVLEQRAAELDDPKARLRAWLERMERVKVEGELAAALDAADASVPPSPLHVKTRLWTEVPGGFQEQLIARKLKLDAIEAEAERRRKQHGVADALKVLSCRVEQSPGDWVVARDVAFTALEWGEPAAAYQLFRRVAEARPFEPHTFVGMARCLEAMDRVDLAKVWYEVALAGKWDERYGAFRSIATVHYLSFLRRHKDDRLESLVPEAEPKSADLIVTVFWNTNGSDVDLHVLDADKAHCYYSEPKTEMGGRMTKDVTGGYGPEMFVLPNAKPGDYAIWAHYFAEDSTRMTTRTRVFATIFENFGRADEKVRTKSLVLTTGKKQHPIAKLVRHPSR